MPKFDFGFGQINDIRLPTIDRSIDLDRTDINQAIRVTAEMSYTPDMLGETGPYKAVVLRVESANSGEVEPEGFLDFIFGMFSGGDKPITAGLKKMTAIKARIPELHGHIPIPTEDGDPQSSDYKDHHIIDLYPTYTSESDREEFTKVKPGDIVIVDYGDKKNYADPIFVTPIAVQQHMPVPGGPGGLNTFSNLPCASPTGEILGNAMAGQTQTSKHSGLSAGAQRSRTTNSTAIIFGDSQANTDLGKGLMKYLQSLGYTPAAASSWTNSESRMSAKGSTPGSWLTSGKNTSPASAGKFGFIEEAVKEHKPGIITICLGGSGVGTGNAKKLVEKIKKVSPNSKILWIGPTPPTVITDMNKARNNWGSSVTNTRSKIEQNSSQRLAYNNTIKEEINGIPDVFFIDPHDYLAEIYKEDPGHGADGLHCTKKGAVELIKAVQSLSGLGDGFPMHPGTSQQKPKYANKSQGGPGGAEGKENPASPSPELEQKLKQVYEKQLQKYASEQQAENFLKDRAKMLGDAGANTTIYQSFLNRDWISGWLAEDGHVKAMSVDETKWQPARVSEIVTWLNFTSYSDSNISRNPYGFEVILPGRKGPGAATSGADNNPLGDVKETIEMLKQTSYEMSAAVYMVLNPGEQKPNPASSAAPSPPCKPIQTYTDSGAGSSSTPGEMAPVGPEVDAGGTGKPFQKPPPKTLDEVDWNKYPQWMIDKWSRGRGFSSNWANINDEVKHKSMMSFAAAEVLERYWRQLFPKCQVFIKSHLRRSGNPISSNHGYGAAMDWEVRYNGLYLPNLYTWASSHYLMNAKRLPPSGGGTYLNMNIPGSNKYNSNKPPGVTGINLSEQGKAAKRSCPAPGSSTNTHYDYRGHCSHKPGKGKTAWIHLDTDADGKDDIKGTYKYKAWLTTYHPKGQLIVDFIASWIKGTNMQPTDFKFPPMSNAVPNWNQASGQEPFGAGDVS